MADTPEHLAHHLEWLYGKGGVYGGDGSPCLCDHAYRDDRQGTGWVRTTTHPKCPHHPTLPPKRKRHSDGFADRSEPGTTNNG